GQGWTEDAGTTPPTDRLFTGQRRYGPKSGIYYYGSRFYSADVGRFLQADSIVPGAGNPQALNRYSYVLNNPLRDTDPTGHGAMIDPIFPGGDEGGGGSGGGGPSSSGAGDGGASPDLGTSIGWGMEFEAGVQRFGWQSSHRTGLSFSNFYFDCFLHRNPCDYFGSPCDGFLCHVFNYVLAAAMLVPVAREAGEVTAADLAGGQLTKVAAGVSGREAGGILANKAAGDAARNAI